MGLDALQIESDVERLYRAAGVDSCLPASLPQALFELALQRHDGLRAVRLVPANDDGDGPLGCLRRERVARRWEYEIEVTQRASASTPSVLWLLGHEAGEWRVHYLDAAPSDSPLCERLANNWAGAFLLPARALRISWECWKGEPNALDIIAAHFCTTPRVVALRLGEALGFSVAVVDFRPEPLFGRPFVQRRGWIASAPIGDSELARLTRHPDEARRFGWTVVKVGSDLRVLLRRPRE